jgi:hypothetical protein
VLCRFFWFSKLLFNESMATWSHDYGMVLVIWSHDYGMLFDMPTHPLKSDIFLPCVLEIEETPSTLHHH